MPTARVDQSTALVLGTGTKTARVDQVTALVLASAPKLVRLDQVSRLVLAKDAGTVRADQVTALVLAAAAVVGACGPVPIFPTLPVGFPVKWRPTFKTTVQESVSGREVRWANQQFGLHEIELPFEVLRDQTQNQTPYSPLAGFTDFMQLCQFWLMMYGSFGIFYFDAPWDDSRLGALVGTGDGTTDEFTVSRTFGLSGAELTEPVGAINQMQAVYLNGVLQSVASYSTGGNQLTFFTPPGNGVVITADFTFYYLCHFISDDQDFEEFLKNIWQVKSLKFRSIYWPLV